MDSRGADRADFSTGSDGPVEQHPTRRHDLVHEVEVAAVARQDRVSVLQCVQVDRGVVQPGDLAWLHTLATGLDASRDNPAYQLRERLMGGIAAPIGTREGLLERFALMIKSWKLYAADETVPMRKFHWRSTGKAAELFPQIEGVRLPAYDGAD
jgi:hypothetical protein